MTITNETVLINNTKWDSAFPNDATTIDTMLAAVNTRLGDVADLTANSITYHYRTNTAGVVDGYITIDGFGSNGTPIIDFFWTNINDELDKETDLSYNATILAYYNRDDETAIT